MGKKAIRCSKQSVLSAVRRLDDCPPSPDNLKIALTTLWVLVVSVYVKKALSCCGEGLGCCDFLSFGRQVKEISCLLEKLMDSTRLKID